MKSSAATKLGIFLLLIGLMAGGLWFWRQSVIQKRAAWSVKAIDAALESRDFVSARSALDGVKDQELREKRSREIRERELADAIQRRDSAVIRQTATPEVGAELPKELLEKADLILAREAVWTRDFAKATALREKWQKQSQVPMSWRLLEVDQLAASGNKEKAREILRSDEWTGDMKALRFARLALLDAREPWKAMESIDEGLKINPREPELLSFRAQIQEAAGRIADARLDYVAAVLSEPANPLYRDMLANFQMRIGEPSNAADTWRDGAAETKVGIFAFKAWFWSKMIGIPLSRPLPKLEQPGWKEVTDAILELPDGAFLSPQLDHALSALRELKDRPEMAWLKVLDALARKDWQRAAERLDWGFPADADALIPGMASRLYVNAMVVAGSDARAASKGRKFPDLSSDAHPYLLEFEQWRARNTKQEDPFVGWMKQPASLVAMLYAHGWQGAAVDLGGGAKLTLTGEWPKWFDYGYARCLLARSGPQVSQQWLETLPRQSEAAKLTYAEILLTQGKPEEGLKKLSEIAQQPSPHASRAAWTLALAELDRGNIKAASDVVNAQAELRESVPGQEILARCALVEQKRDVATSIYTKLGEQSVDAMIFLSKEAFGAKNWAEARKWTVLLARRFPSEPKFRENLLNIDAAEKAKP